MMSNCESYDPATVANDATFFVSLNDTAGDENGHES